MEIKRHELEKDDTFLRLGVSQLEDYLNDLYNFKGFSSGDFALDGTGATGTGVAASAKAGYINFVDAQQGYAIASFRRPQYWKHGHFAADLYISSAATVSSGTVRLVPAVFGHLDAEVLTSPSLEYGFTVQDVDMPGVADTLLKVSYTLSTNVDLLNVDYLGLRVFRNGTHANDDFTNTMRLHYAELHFLSSR